MAPVATNQGNNGKCPELMAVYAPARFVYAEGNTLEAMREAFVKTDVYRAGDARLVWVNEGDLYPEGLFAKHYTRTPSPAVGEELVEKVARAIHYARFRPPGREREPLPMDFSDEEYCTRLARAAIASILPEPRGWQPIETAPKDGRYIIAARFKGQSLGWVSHTRWITVDEICDLEGGDPEDYEPGWTDGNRDDEPIFPTHWKSLEPPILPEPPSGGVR